MEEKESNFLIDRGRVVPHGKVIGPDMDPSIPGWPETKPSLLRAVAVALLGSVWSGQIVTINIHETWMTIRRYVTNATTSIIGRLDLRREIREVVEVGGKQLIRLTTPDSRWYSQSVSVDGTAENRKWVYVPSVTWIIDTGYPKGKGFEFYLKTSGFNADEVVQLAGERGSIVHQACERIARGGSVSLSDKFENPETGQQREISANEFHCAMTFAEWWESERPEIIAIERTVWSGKYNYCGTEDYVLRLKSTNYKIIHVVDVKTSKNVYSSHELQVSALKHADSSLPRNAQGKVVGVKLGILQVGYTLNKKKQFKYTEVPDRFPLFLAAQKIWKHEAGSQKPHQRDYPMELKLS